jgi:hypothetical protein
LREAGQTSEAARFSSEAARLRTELGDTASAANAGSPIDRRRPWFISVVLLLIAGAFMLGRADGSDSDEIDTGFTTIPESEPVGSSTPDRVSVDSSEVLAYAGDSTIFSGDTNVSIAARILAPTEGAAARLEFQVNDRAEFAYRDGMAPITDQLESECRGGLYSNTGSGGGGYSVPIDVVILGANGRDRAVELLTSPTWTDQEVLGSFSGDVALIANYTEDCVRRTTPSGDKLFLAYRQVYEIKRIDITPIEPMTHVVVRGVLADGSPTTWTSTDVMPLVSGG